MPRPKNTSKERTRFHGFDLTDAPRDRLVSAWIDEQPNAAERIKTILYSIAVRELGLEGDTNAPDVQAVGQVRMPSVARRQVEEYQPQSPVPSSAVEGDEGEDMDLDDPNVSALLSALDS